MLSLAFNTHAPEHQSSGNTSAFEKVFILADDQLIKCAAGCYLPS